MKKYIKIVFSFCLIIVLSSFSLVVSAESTDGLVFTMSVNNVQAMTNEQEVGYLSNIDPDTLPTDRIYAVGGDSVSSSEPYTGVLSRVRVSNSSGVPIMKANSRNEFTFTGIYFLSTPRGETGSNIQRIDFRLNYTDGTYRAYETSDTTTVMYADYNGIERCLYKVSTVILPDKDVSTLYMRIYFDVPNNQSYSYTCGVLAPEIKIVEDTWLNSILNIIRNYINNVFQAVTNIVPNISNFFSNLINTVIDFIRGEWLLPSLDPLKENLQQYYEDEDNLFSQFSQHVDEFGNVLNNAEQRFGNARGILAVSNMLSSFIQKNSFLSMLLWFSLAIGIISFILGSSWLVGSFIHNDDKPTHPAQHTHVTMFNFFNRRE